MKDKQKDMSHAEKRFRISNFDTCCEQGVRVHCICRISIRCPVHGSMCVGTHD